MSKHYHNLLDFISSHAPLDRIESLLADLDALQAEATTARERALDEVCDALYDEMDEDALEVVYDVVNKLRTSPADPELARLEREVARAAIAHQHECAAYMDDRAPNRFKKQMDANRALHKAEWELHSYIRRVKRRGEKK